MSAVVTKEVILETINTGSKMFKDMHRGANAELQPLEGYIVLESDDVCVIHKNNIFCLNPLYLNSQNQLCLSTGSVAGNVDLRKYSLEEAVEKYNADMRELKAAMPSMADDYKLIVDYKEF